MDVVFDPNEEASDAGPPAGQSQQPPKRKIPDDVQQLFRCRRTVFAMLLKRGYVAPPPPDALNVGKFVAKYGLTAERGALAMVASHQDNQDRKIFVVRASCCSR